MQRHSQPLSQTQETHLGNQVTCFDHSILKAKLPCHLLPRWVVLCTAGSGITPTQACWGKRSASHPELQELLLSLYSHLQPVWGMTGEMWVSPAHTHLSQDRMCCQGAREHAMCTGTCNLQRNTQPAQNTQETCTEHTSNLHRCVRGGRGSRLCVVDTERAAAESIKGMLSFPLNLQRINFNANIHMKCLLVMKEVCAYTASPGQPCSKAECCATKQLFFRIYIWTLCLKISAPLSSWVLWSLCLKPTQLKSEDRVTPWDTGRRDMGLEGPPRSALLGPAPTSSLFLVREPTNNLGWCLAVIKQNIAISLPFAPHESFFHL